MCPFAIPNTGAVRRVARPEDRLETEMLKQTFVVEFAALTMARAQARKSFAARLKRGEWHAYKGRPAAPQKSAPPPPKQSPAPAPSVPKPEEPKPSEPPAKGH
jgi:hypothetical protein